MNHVKLKPGVICAIKNVNWFDMRVTSVHCSAALRDGIARPDSTDENDVLIENVKSAGILTLNRPKVLNVLNISMIRKIYSALKNWECSKKCIIIKGSGQKAFCAGGDIKVLANTSGLPGGKKSAQNILRCDYALNYLIGTYKSPYIAVLNGITMGAGACLAVYGRYRIATENTLFAMPETFIGVVPGAGATFFLPRLKGKLGYYLGLTGHRLKGTDVLLGGIATHYVPSERLEDLTKELLESNSEDIDGTIKKYQPDNFDSEFTLSPYLKQIDNCFSAPTMEGVIHKLEADGSDWAVKTLKLLEQMSPTALSVTLQAMQKGSRQSLAEWMKVEFRVVSTFIGDDSDLYEGVRARLIDKDQKPVWKPKLLSQVSQESVAARFAKVPNEEELNLDYE